MFFFSFRVKTCNKNVVKICSLGFEGERTFVFAIETHRLRVGLKLVPGSYSILFNPMLLVRFLAGQDTVAWHSLEQVCNKRFQGSIPLGLL